MRTLLALLPIVGVVGFAAAMVCGVALAGTQDTVPARFARDEARLERLERLVACMKTRGVVLEGDAAFVQWRATPACLRLVGP